MQQARPRAALEKAVRAGAQQERALQRRDGAVDRPHRGERAVVVARRERAPRCLRICGAQWSRGDQDVGKRLVVAQQHVEARPQALDQIGFEQQRLGLGRGGDEFHRRGRRDHALDPGVVAGRPRVGRDPLPDVLGLADVEHLAGRVEHAIDAGRGRRVLGIAQRSRRVRPPSVPWARRDRARWFPRPPAGLLLVVLDEVARRVDVFFRAVHRRQLWSRAVPVVVQRLRSGAQTSATSSRRIRRS